MPPYTVEANGKTVHFEAPAGASQDQLKTLAARALKQAMPSASFARPVLEKRLREPMRDQGTISATPWTLSGAITDKVAGALSAFGMDEAAAQRRGHKVTDFLNDLTPVGGAVEADQARQAFGRGNYLGAAGHGALAALSAVPEAGGAAKAVFLGARPVAKWIARSPAEHEAAAIAQGFTVDAFHGSARPDRIVEADLFDPKRATSGPMAYFTDNPKMATNYATGKQDTSRLAQHEGDFNDWFKADIGRGKPKTLDQLWNHLTPDQQERARQNLGRVTEHEDYLDNGQPNPLAGQFYLGDGPGGRQHWEYALRAHRGNPITAARDVWLDSGNLYDQEDRFVDVMRAAGLGDVPLRYDSPHMTNPGIIPVKLRMGNTLDTTDKEALQNLMGAIDTASKGKRYKSGLKRGVDLWDKLDIGLPEFRDNLREDLITGQSPMAFTAIPDDATNVMRGMGYESITDLGGKNGGEGHTVFIPFSPTQVRSRFAPFATHDPWSEYLLGEATRGRP